MSVSSPNVLAPKSSNQTPAWVTPKNLFLSSPKAVLVQKKDVEKSTGLPASAQLPVNASPEPHSSPVLVSGPQASPIATGSTTAARPETATELRDRLFSLSTEGLTAQQLGVRNSVLRIEQFIDKAVPKREHLAELCQSLKNLAGIGNSGFKKLNSEHSRDWLRLLAFKVEDFLTHLSALEEPRYRWNEMSMNQVALLCYGLKACYDLNRNGALFSTEQSMQLLQAGRRITRKLMDQIHHRHLIHPQHHSSGDVLSVLAWITSGLQCTLELPGKQQVMLLGGCTTEAGKVSLTDIGISIFDYFEQGRAPSMTARQIGKLMNGIGRLVAAEVLVVNPKPQEKGIARERLRRALRDWCASPSMVPGGIAAGSQSEPGGAMNAVIVGNCIDGIRRLMHAGSLEAGALETMQIIGRSLQWIQQAMSRPDLSLSELQNFRTYLQSALSFVIVDQPVRAQLAAIDKAIAARPS